MQAMLLRGYTWIMKGDRAQYLPFVLALVETVRVDHVDKFVI